MHRQFYTSCLSTFDDSWVPIDHFFYASKKKVLVHLETHASVRTESGFGVSVISGTYGKPGYKAEEFDTVPQALRRMAEIIEQAEQKKHPVACKCQEPYGESCALARRK